MFSFIFPPKNKIRNSMGISSFIDGGGRCEIGDFIRSATHMSAALENVYRGVGGGAEVAVMGFLITFGKMYRSWV